MVPHSFHYGITLNEYVKQLGLIAAVKFDKISRL